MRTRGSDRGMLDRAVEFFSPPRSQAHEIARRRQTYQPAVPQHDLIYGAQNAASHATARHRNTATRSSDGTPTPTPQRAQTYNMSTTNDRDSERTSGTQTDRRAVERTASVGRGNGRGKSPGRGEQVSLPPPVVLLPPPPSPPPSPRHDTSPEQKTEEQPEPKHSSVVEYPKIRDLGADQANVTKPRHTTDKSTYKSDPEIAELRAKLKEAEDLAERRDQRNRELVTKFNELRDLKAKWKASSDKYRQELDEEKNLAATRLVKHQHELEVQQHKFDRLNAAHIKNVNSVGTGLEPITDQEFTSKFRDLQDQIGQWSRKAFKHRGQQCSYEQLPLSLKEIILPRVHTELAKLRFAQLVETVTWAYIEDMILSAWFPDVSSTFTQHMTALHNWIRAGDKSPNYDRSEFWRAYTVSMLFQYSGVQQSLAEGEDQFVELVTLLYKLQVDPVELEDHFYATLKELLYSARTLAAELKCQRAVYEVDHNIRVGDPYDDESMVDVSYSTEFDDEEEAGRKQMVVTGVIVKGVVKRPWPGSPDVEAQLARAKVKVMAM
ncbi:hypothetical protein K440DRAFT_32096 [Wilcoxina mikolae CBS 423.85]|nr:hypothetical protein K440DRAFT_32096 [Wilcoxina mikolae CBS 423.85]